MKAFKAFIKPFEAPQKSLEIKILVNFLYSPRIRTGRINTASSLYSLRMTHQNKVKTRIMSIFLVNSMFFRILQDLLGIIGKNPIKREHFYKLS